MTNAKLVRWASGIRAGFLLVLGACPAPALAFCSPPGDLYTSPLVNLKIVAGFGATPSQCEIAYGSPKVTTSDSTLVNPLTRCYVTSGWTILVGYDEQDRAEQFIFSKASTGLAPVLTDMEQKAMLNQFQGGSAWNFPQNSVNGPIGTRADEQAMAAYITKSSKMVIMTAAGMKRHLKALHRDSPQP